MMLLKLLSRMERSRFDAAVISLSDQGLLSEKLTSMGFPVYSINMKSGIPTPAAVIRLARKIRQIKPDLIQGWMYHGNLAAQLGAALAPARVPVLWNIRGSHYTLKNEKPATAATIWLTAKLSGLPTTIINNSAVSALGHEQKLGYKPDRRVVIPNGFDTSVFAPSQEARWSVRNELGLSEETLLVGLIARFHPVKNHMGFLRAASLLQEKHPNVHFVLAGCGVDTSNETLMVTIKRLDLSTNVHLLGERSDIPRLLAAVDLATLSSSSEGFPNVIGEAMACGVPCVVTDVGDSASLIGETGLVVPPCDPGALARAWQELIEMDGENRRKVGLLGRQRITENFSIDAIARRYEQLYERVFVTRARAETN